jgi:colicin import membrane protein
MERWSDKLGGLALSLAVHFIAGAALFVGLAWTEVAKPVSVQGPVVEAVLVTAPLAAAPPRPRVATPKPQRPKPPLPEVEKPKPDVVRAPPPPAQDTREQERVAREGVLPPVDERREQEERRRRDQELLEQEQLTKMERERLTQLEDIRRLRQEAERKLRLEQERLAQLEDRAAEAREPAPRPEPQPVGQTLPGNEGTDNDLRARYALAIQTLVTQNWLRPDTAQPGLRCTVRIVQIPGGEVISANVIAPCNGDELTRRSLEAAVLRAQPLPYRGYEAVFTRSIDFNFRYDG